MNTKELIYWLVERNEPNLPAVVDLIEVAYGERLANEYRYRQEMVADVARAKRELGLRGSAMNQSFFKDIWPKARDALLKK